MYRTILKPLLDVVFSALLLVLLSPLFFLVLILLLTTLKGNPFFVQSRPGKNEQLFEVIKFRTMKDIRNKDGELLSDENRLTKVGKLIRNFSIDEIPQLINVLNGDMSIVGPRPLLPQYLPLYTANERRRHNVKPGITGLAQVSGRNNLAWKSRFALDVYYVDHLSWKLDLKIMWLTFKKVFSGTDVNKKGQSTIEPFSGNE